MKRVWSAVTLGLLALVIGFALMQFGFDTHRGGEGRIVYIPETQVGLIPPPGFKVSENIAGVVHPDPGFIAVQVSPADRYASIRKGIVRELTSYRGVKLLRIGRLEGFSGEHLYYRYERDNCADVAVCRRTHTRLSQKFSLVIPKYGKTFKVYAEVPYYTFEKTGLTIRDIQDALASVVITKKPAPPLRLFDFEFGYLGKFSETKRDKGSIWYRDGTGYFYVNRYRENSPIPEIEDPVKFSHWFIEFPYTRTVHSEKIEHEGPVTIDGLSGHMMVGTGNEKDSGDKILFMQWLLMREGGHYIRLYASAPVHQRSHYIEEFTRMAESLRLIRD